MIKDENNDHRHPFHLEEGRVIFDKPPTTDEARRETRESEAHEFARNQVKLNRRTSRFNGLLVLATFSSVGIAVWQNTISQTAANAAKSSADTASRTLKEMQNGQGAQDTHTLAQQAVAQAIQTTALATASQKQADQTQRLADNALKQARAANALAAQAQRSADYAKQSIETAVEADRPWIGGSISVSAFASGSKPVLNYSFANSGKRPARVLEIYARGFVLPAFPPALGNTFLKSQEGSTAIIVPGSSFGNADVTQEIVSFREWEMIENRTLAYFAVATLTYQDTGTGQPYFTHVCIRYLPGKPSGKWINCREYNDAN